MGEKATMLTEKLLQVQTELKAPKDQWNDFSKFSYRSCEDILEAAKPLLSGQGILVTLSDELVQLGDRFYVKATATAILGADAYAVTAYAREQETKKGMDGSQITGSASSYARKYALNGLFLIDDNKEHDGDTTGKKKKAETKKPVKDDPAKQPVPDELLTFVAIPDEYMAKTGEKNGKPWEKHGFRFGKDWYSTFSNTQAKTLNESIEYGYKVQVSYKMQGNFKTIIDVVAVEDAN